MGEKKLLFDYYERVVGTPEEMPFFEITLYEESEEELLMETYTEGGTPEEHVEKRTVSRSVLDAAMQIVKKYHMHRWNDKEGTCIDGMMYVCKFWHKGKLIRVSSAQMQEDGVKAFAAVQEALR